MRVVLVGVTVIVTACYGPRTERACEVFCTVNPTNPSDRGPCPAGLTCGADGLCRSEDGICGPVVEDGPPVGDDARTDGTMAGPCPPGMTLAFVEDFADGLTGWSSITPANGTAVAVVSGPQPPVIRVTRSTLDGTMIVNTNKPSAAVDRIVLRFDVLLDGSGPPNDIMFAQLENGPQRTLVRLSAQNDQVTIEEATATSGALSIGTAWPQPTGWVSGSFDATFSPTRNLVVSFNGSSQSFSNFVLQPTGMIETFFGVFVESAGIPGTPSVEVDNVLLCTSNQGQP